MGGFDDANGFLEERKGLGGLCPSVLSAPRAGLSEATPAVLARGFSKAASGAIPMWKSRLRL